MIAFWKYDHYPYCLSGEVLHLNPDGAVRTKTYGGMIFKPIILMDDETGKPIAKRLEELRLEYAEEQRKLATEYKQKAKEAAYFLNI